MRAARLLSIFAVALSGGAACSSSSSSPDRCGGAGEVVTVDATSLEDDAGGPDAGAAAPRVGDVFRGATCESVCPQKENVCSVTGAEAGRVTLECSVDCTGRRPPGHFVLPARRDARLGERFARMAALEAASVDAFRILADELAAHRAPRALVAACRRAARDEIRHARAMGALARRHGARAERVAVRRAPTRSLEAIARENAVEGCVRETFGALVAHGQARAESDVVVRAAMKRIAHDETRHAALSWSIDAWARARLSREARARVDAARAAAVRELVADAPPPARALAASLEATLWRAAA